MVPCPDNRVLVLLRIFGLAKLYVPWCEFHELFIQNQLVFFKLLKAN